MQTVHSHPRHWQCLKVNTRSSPAALERLEKLELYATLQREGCCRKTALQAIGWKEGKYYYWRNRYRDRGVAGLEQHSTWPGRLMSVVQLVLLALLWTGPGSIAGAAGAEDTARAARQQLVLVFGDSLSDPYRIPEPQGWVALLTRQLAAGDWPVWVVNGSLAGATTTSGAARLPGLLEHFNPDLVILELGGNDGLRGLPVSVMRANLSDMIETIQQHGAQVLLVGIRIPPNYGPRYTEPFFRTFTELAELYELPLVPFMLEGIATRPELMQDDGIHPTAEAQPLILANIWTVLEPVLAEMVGR